MILFIFSIFLNFLCKYRRFLHFHMISAVHSQSFFMQSLPLYTSWLFFMSLNDDIVEIEKPDGICSSTIVVDDFSGLLLHPSMFSIKNLRSA